MVDNSHQFFERYLVELEKGFNVFCATCPHHLVATDKGQDHCGRSACVGPIKGGTFPDYTGPIPREKFSKVCLLCMNHVLALQVLVKGVPEFGLCRKHRKSLKFLRIGDGLSSQEPLVTNV